MLDGKVAIPKSVMDDLFKGLMIMINRRLISISGAHVLLRPLCADDFEKIFIWRSNITDLYLWEQHPEVLSDDEFYSDFKSFLSHVVHTIMMIETKSSRDLIGMVYAYRADYLNNHAFLCTYLDSAYRGCLYGAEAAILFIDYLFSYFSFRKLYAEIYEYNVDSMSNSLKAGFIEEGRLKKHRWYRNKYNDMYILALYQRDFYKRFQRILDKLKDHDATV